MKGKRKNMKRQWKKNGRKWKEIKTPWKEIAQADALKKHEWRWFQVWKERHKQCSPNTNEQMIRKTGFPILGRHPKKCKLDWVRCRKSGGHGCFQCLLSFSQITLHDAFACFIILFLCFSFLILSFSLSAAPEFQESQWKTMENHQNEGTWRAPTENERHEKTNE